MSSFLFPDHKRLSFTIRRGDFEYDLRSYCKGGYVELYDGDTYLGLYQVTAVRLLADKSIEYMCERVLAIKGG